MNKITPKRFWLKSLLCGPNGKPYAEINENNLMLFYGPLFAKWSKKTIPWSSIKEFTIEIIEGKNGIFVYKKLGISLNSKDLGLDWEYDDMPCAKGTSKEEWKDFLNDCLEAYNQGLLSPSH